MFCPQCGTNQNNDLKFCKSCGANLHSVRQALTKPESSESFDWKKTWFADMILTAKEVKRRDEEIERQRGITPEIKRFQEIKNGVITSSVGIGVMVFLYVFMQGLVLSGNIPPNAVDILNRVWIAGVIPFFVGLGLIFNGAIVSKKQVEALRQIPITQPVGLEGGADNHSLRAADTPEFIPSDASVTEHTTRELRNRDTE
jgi:hypothetical protein